MSELDLFRSHNIPPEISDTIFLLAGPAALASVRCTNKANAEAYKDVALGLARRGLWRCRVDSAVALHLAETHKLLCLRVVPRSPLSRTLVVPYSAAYSRSHPSSG